MSEQPRGSWLYLLTDPSKRWGPRVYTRWRRGEPRLVKLQVPLDPQCPVSTWPCPACDQPIGSMEPVGLVAIGPDGLEELEQYQQARWFNCWTTVLHANCAHLRSESGLDELVMGLVLAPLVAALEGPQVTAVPVFDPDDPELATRYGGGA